MRAVLLLLPLLVWGAPSDVALFGTVLDPSGAVVPNALVTAFNDDTGVRRSSVSDQQGFYAIAALAPGHYKVLVRKEGFLTLARAGLTLGVQQNVRCDFVLRVGPVEQVVTVEGGLSLLTSQPGSPGVVIGSKLLEELPLGGRGLAGVLDLVPGVISTPANTGEAGQFTTGGQRPNTNYFTVDGVGFNTGVSGAGMPGQFPGGTLPAMTAIGSMHSLAPPDAIDQVQIQTSSYTPEFAPMPGAQIAILTRSGTNDFHGTVSESINNDALNANDWLANSFGLRRPAMRANDLAAAIGGPIRRNRTFFFAAYEQVNLRQPLVWRLPVPSLSERQSAAAPIATLLDAFPLPNGPDLGQGLAELRVSTTRPAEVRVGSLRVDHALTSRMNLFARYSNSPSSSEFGYSQVSQSNFQQSSLTAGLSVLVRPAVSNDLRVNRSAATVDSAWTSTNAGGAGALSLGSYMPAPVSFQSLSIDGVGVLNLGDGGRNSQSQTSVVDGLTLIHGNHHFRIGAEYRRLTPSSQGPLTSASLNFTSLSSLMGGAAGWLTFAQSTTLSTSLQTASLSAQDTWTINARLTMTYGIRWEIAPAPLATAAHAVYSDPAAPPVTGVPIWSEAFTNVAPRVAAAYRLTANSRSVLRAGFGVFYDSSFGAATDEINAAPYSSWQLGIPYGAAAIGQAPSVAYGFAGGLALPRVLEWNVNWQHAWGDRASSSISYVGSRGERLLRREASLDSSTELAELELATSHGTSAYNGLEAGYRQRLVGGLQGLLSYTWSHSIDTASWDSAVFLVQTGLSAILDRADSNFDARQAFSAAVSYDLRSWTIDGLFRARTGFPIDVLAAETYSGFNFANVVRPDLVAGTPIWIATGAAPGGRLLNPAAFSVPVTALQGDLGRNAIGGFGMSQLDLAIHRVFTIKEGASLEVRGDLSNALNHPAFADPERFLSSPLFGQATSMLNLMLGSGTPRSGLTPAFQVGGPRVIQIGATFRF